MNNFISNEDKMNSFIEKFCYLVVFPDKKVELFKSLREILISTITELFEGNSHNHNYGLERNSNIHNYRSLWWK